MPIVDEILVDIAVDARKINEGMRQLNQRAERLEESTDEATDELKRLNDTSLNRLQQGIEATSAAGSRMGTIFRGALTQIGFFITQLAAQLASTFTGSIFGATEAIEILESRLHSIGLSTEEVNNRIRFFQQEAVALSVPVEILSQSFLQLEQGFAGANLTAQELTQAYRNVATSIVNSGLSIEEILPTIQRLAEAGQNVSDPLPAILPLLEKFPDLARAFREEAHSAGIIAENSFIALKRAAEEGAFTLEDLGQVMANLNNQTEATGDANKSLASAFTSLNEASRAFIGNIDRNLGVTDRFHDAVRALANNFDTVAVRGIAVAGSITALATASGAFNAVVNNMGRSANLLASALTGLQRVMSSTIARFVIMGTLVAFIVGTVDRLRGQFRGLGEEIGLFIEAGLGALANALNSVASFFGITSDSIDALVLKLRNIAEAVGASFADVGAVAKDLFVDPTVRGFEIILGQAEELTRRLLNIEIPEGIAELGQVQTAGITPTLPTGPSDAEIARDAVLGQIQSGVQQIMTDTLDRFATQLQESAIAPYEDAVERAQDRQAELTEALQNSVNALQADVTAQEAAISRLHDANRIIATLHGQLLEFGDTESAQRLQDIFESNLRVVQDHEANIVDINAQILEVEKDSRDKLDTLAEDIVTAQQRLETARAQGEQQRGAASTIFGLAGGVIGAALAGPAGAALGAGLGGQLGTAVASFQRGGFTGTGTGVAGVVHTNEVVIPPDLTRLLRGGVPITVGDREPAQIVVVNQLDPSVFDNYVESPRGAQMVRNLIAAEVV